MTELRDVIIMGIIGIALGAVAIVGLTVWACP
jgi:hypothetical protein